MQLSTEDPRNLRQVPFLLEWIDQHGLISGCHDWAVANLQPGESVGCRTPGSALEHGVGINIPFTIAKNQVGKIRIHVPMLFSEALVINDRRMSVVKLPVGRTNETGVTKSTFLPALSDTGKVWVPIAELATECSKNPKLIPFYVADLLDVISKWISTACRDRRKGRNDFASSWRSAIRVPGHLAVCNVHHRRLMNYMRSELAAIEEQRDYAQMERYVTTWIETSKSFLADSN